MNIPRPWYNELSLFQACFVLVYINCVGRYLTSIANKRNIKLRCYRPPLHVEFNFSFHVTSVFETVQPKFPLKQRIMFSNVCLNSTIRINLQYSIQVSLNSKLKCQCKRKRLVNLWDNKWRFLENNIHVNVVFCLINKSPKDSK